MTLTSQRYLVPEGWDPCAVSAGDLEAARQICIAQFGEDRCDDARIIAIATDLAAGMSVEEVIEWVDYFHKP